MGDGHQRERATRSWRPTIIRERVNLDRILADNPGLKSRLDALFAAAYADARREAIAETRLPARTFPAEATLSLRQVRDDAYLPGRLV